MMKKKELITSIASATDLTAAEVTKVLKSLSDVCVGELKANKMFVLNDLVRLRVVDKPALPERQMKSPATGKMVTVKAKPASTRLKVTAAKHLRDIVKNPA